MFFPDTHEAIIDQETWDKANWHVRRAPKRVANGTYSHRLSGMVFCADCGARMGYVSLESQKRENGKTFDCDSAFQCGGYRNQKRKCCSHYVKTSAQLKEDRNTTSFAEIFRPLHIEHLACGYS